VIPGLLLAVAMASLPEAAGEIQHEMTVPAAVFEHITDSRNIEFQIPLVDKKISFTTPDWKIAIAGHELDLSITKHVLWLFVAAILLALSLWSATRKRPKDLIAAGVTPNIAEALTLYIRDEIAVKNIGEHDADRYTPYLATAFFFILFCALLGMLPWASTVTGNLSVTATLAAFTFVVTQAAGMRTQGFVGYWLHLVPAGVPWWLYPIMIPVELMGLFAKPFALCVRLFANMIAGHIVIFFLLGLIFLLGSIWVAPVSVAFAFAIYLLEIFVALIQAYIFTMLSAVFIGMAAHPH
jgi:F-type H+-transporting ATPase subunit a